MSGRHLLDKNITSLKQACNTTQQIAWWRRDDATKQTDL